MGTHINVYKEEATVALAKVKGAVVEAESKLEALLTQIEALSAPVTPPVEDAPVVPPAEEPTAPVEEPAAPVEASTPVSAPTATKPSK